MNLIKKGSTDVTRYVKLVDSAAGTPETGYTIANLDLQYTRNRTAPAAKVDAVALAATDTAHTDNRAIEVDGTSSPGLYRIDWPDAAFATGADKVVLCVSGSGLDPCFEEIQLVDFDPADGVRLGLTALPNAAAEAAGGLYTRGTGAGQINQVANGMIDANAVRHLGTAYATPTVAGVPEVDVTHVLGTGVDVAEFPTAGEIADEVRVELATELARVDVATSTRASQASVDTIDDFLDTEIAAIKAVIDQFAAAQSEPSSAPAANATPLQKIAWLAALARNKVTQTATTQALRNDADSGNIATASVSDDGSTFTRGEWS